MNIVHISDLHFTASGHTLDWTSNPFLHDSQNSQEKATRIASWIVANHDRLGTNIVILTGDLTDSGDEEDYAIVESFLGSLQSAGLSVFVIPGNHDYCKEGNLVFADICHQLRAPLDQVYVPVPRDVPLLPFHLPIIPVPTRILDCPSWIRDPLLGTIVAPLVRAASEAFLPHSYQGPAELFDYITKEIVTFMKNSDSNMERRSRFIANVTGYTDYPHVVMFPDAALVLLDSMQGQLDEPNPSTAVPRATLVRGSDSP
jgi:hypothetical protein